MHYTIDEKVWTRDLYGDPGPFPIAECLKHWRNGPAERNGGGATALEIGTEAGSSDTETRDTHLCVAGAGCCDASTPKLTRTIEESEMGMVMRRSVVGSRNSLASMVSLPSVVERRSQITIVLDEVGL